MEPKGMKKQRKGPIAKNPSRFQPLIDLQNHFNKNGIQVELQGNPKEPESLGVQIKYAEQLRQMATASQQEGKTQNIIHWLKELQKGNPTDTHPTSLPGLLQTWLEKHAPVPNASRIEIAHQPEHVQRYSKISNGRIQFAIEKTPECVRFTLKSETP